VSAALPGPVRLWPYQREIAQIRLLKWATDNGSVLTMRRFFRSIVDVFDDVPNIAHVEPLAARRAFHVIAGIRLRDAISVDLRCGMSVFFFLQSKSALQAQKQPARLTGDVAERAADPVIHTRCAEPNR
jgi:hypothetical protein